MISLEFVLSCCFSRNLIELRGKKSIELFRKFKRVASLLGISDHEMFLMLGPEVAKAVTGLRKLLSLLSPKKGEKMVPARLLDALREEMLSRHAKEAEENENAGVPVLKIRDVIAVANRKSCTRSRF